MATWLEHVRLSFGGTLGTAVKEQWSNTVRFACRSRLDDATQPSIIVTGPQLDAAMPAMRDTLVSWFEGQNSRIGTDAHFEWVKLNMINTLGKQWDPQTHQLYFPAHSGVAGGQPHWYETVALTMRTALPRGRAHSGRIYPPLVASFPELGSPYIPATIADNMASNWATVLNQLSENLSDALPAPAGIALEVVPVIGSPATATGPNPGGALLQRVTGVVVDRVADVMHSRTQQAPRLESARTNVQGSTPGLD